LEKKQAQFAQRQYDEQAAVEKQIDDMLATKAKIPPPTVMHDKSELYAADIFLPGVTIGAGNKILIEDATVKLTKGRKYGLVGRNGTGKTTLINAICRKEIDKMPDNVHILQVEQEVPGDDMTILDHVLECDVERTRLMKRGDEIPLINTDKMEEEDKMALEEELRDVIE
jgi:ATP-binding cassette subfamily F protein 3